VSLQCYYQIAHSRAEICRASWPSVRPVRPQRVRVMSRTRQLPLKPNGNEPRRCSLLWGLLLKYERGERTTNSRPWMAASAFVSSLCVYTISPSDVCFASRAAVVAAWLCPHTSQLILCTQHRTRLNKTRRLLFRHDSPPMARRASSSPGLGPSTTICTAQTADLQHLGNRSKCFAQAGQ
jgi:hypothetical protein